MKTAPVILVSLLLAAGCDRVPDSDKLEAVHQASGHPTGTVTRAQANVAIAELALKLGETGNDFKQTDTLLGVALEKDPQLVVDFAQNILKQDPDHYYALTRITEAYIRQSNLQRALHYAGQCYRVRPGPDALMLVGQVYEAQGQKPEARNTYRKILDEDPDHADARARLEAL